MKWREETLCSQCHKTRKISVKVEGQKAKAEDKPEEQNPVILSEHWHPIFKQSLTAYG